MAEQTLTDGSPLPLRRAAGLTGKRLLGAVLLTGMLSACRTTPTGAIEEAQDWGCIAFHPIYWSARDTAETVRQVRSHNAAWVAACGK